MKVGRLRNRVTIESYTNAPNSYGEMVMTWATYQEVFAEIRSVSGREYMQFDKSQGEVSHVITIRETDGVLPKMRVTYGARTFEVEAVLADRTGAKMMQLMCNEKVQ